MWFKLVFREDNFAKQIISRSPKPEMVLTLLKVCINPCLIEPGFDLPCKL